MVVGSGVGLTGTLPIRPRYRGTPLLGGYHPARTNISLPPLILHFILFAADFTSPLVVHTGRNPPDPSSSSPSSPDHCPLHCRRAGTRNAAPEKGTGNTAPGKVRDWNRLEKEGFYGDLDTISTRSSLRHDVHICLIPAERRFWKRGSGREDRKRRSEEKIGREDRKRRHVIGQDPWLKNSS